MQCGQTGTAEPSFSRPSLRRALVDLPSVYLCVCLCVCVCVSSVFVCLCVYLCLCEARAAARVAETVLFSKDFTLLMAPLVSHAFQRFHFSGCWIKTMENVLVCLDPQPLVSHACYRSSFSGCCVGFLCLSACVDVFMLYVYLCLWVCMCALR